MKKYFLILFPVILILGILMGPATIFRWTIRVEGGFIAKKRRPLSRLFQSEIYYQLLNNLFEGIIADKFEEFRILHGISLDFGIEADSGAKVCNHAVNITASGACNSFQVIYPAILYITQ